MQRTFGVLDIQRLHHRAAYRHAYRVMYILLLVQYCSIGPFHNLYV
jgi:hypothetical protein